jgi:capsular polysaccharide export protein
LIKVFSRGISKKPYLTAFLGDEITLLSSQLVSSTAGWGLRPTANKARIYAKNNNLPYLALEDGFIHSLGQGVLGSHACSMVVDPLGIYYDATSPSLLENILVHDPENQLTPELQARARHTIQRIVASHISKYNNAPLSADLRLGEGKKILLVDQAAGDMSLQYGLATTETFSAMLHAALAEHPDAKIIIKTHPDVLTGKKKGCFPLRHPDPRIRVIAQPVNPISLLKQVDHVYVATSQLGFESLMVGKPVTCFGVPFYAGWGLTDDRADPTLPVFKRRHRKCSLEEVFAAAYILYTRYVHPDYKKRCELEPILDYFEEQYHCFAENEGRLFCFGFTLWKRNYIRRFLQSPGNQIHFVWTAKAAKAKGFTSDCRIIVWGNRAIEEARFLSEAYHLPIWRIEDGFIRSVNLGSDFTPPLSLVLDKQGIYYNPNEPSDLETTLQTHVFSDALLERAKALRSSLVALAISKYNLGAILNRDRIKAKPSQRIVLVPGQVEDDASIRLGCRDVNTNASLLCAVREANPDAYIIYKPHPDVISGNRLGAVPKNVLSAYCDVVLDDVSITDCLNIAHEVHTMTSLVGFEALLRQLPVTCYGLPFYAGWGLTCDRHAIPRRTRRLTLEQLVAATLILYPRYINWQTKAFTTPEFAIHSLHQQIQTRGGKPTARMPWLQRQTKKLWHIAKGFFHAS